MFGSVTETGMASSRGSAGLYRFTDPADGETYLAVHAGLDSAQRVFAAFDQPDRPATGPARFPAPRRGGRHAPDG